MVPVVRNCASRLHSLLEDIVILMVSFLEPPAIIILSQTCRRFHDFAQLRIVWTNACMHHVLARGYIFPSTPPISEMSTEDLRSHALRAYRLSRQWIEAQRLGGSDARGLDRAQRTKPRELYPRRWKYIEQTAGTSVSEVRFLPYTAPDSSAGGQHLVVTLGKSVWSVLSVWSVTTAYGGGCSEQSSRKVAEWGPRGAIFTGFVVNDNPDSGATMAISFQLHEQYFVKLLSLSSTLGGDIATGTYQIIELHTMRTPFVPKTLSGDLLVLADDDAWVEIWDWRSGTCAVLEHVDGQPTIQTNECLQVFLSPESKSVLVARARSIHLFPWPHLALDASGESGNTHDSVDTNPNIYRPLASYSFGWVDGMAISACPGRPGGFEWQSRADSCPLPTFNILVRGESDDPWASDVQQLQVWRLVPNPEYYASLTCSLTSAESKQSSEPPNRLIPAYGDPSTSTSLPSTSTSGSFPPSSTSDPATSTSATPTTTSESISGSVSLPPYTFPPTLATTIPCLHGALRCKQVALGRFGTAVWIRPPVRQGWGTGDWEHTGTYAGGVDMGLTVLTEDVSSAGGGNGILPSALGSRSLDSHAKDRSAESEVLVGVSLNRWWGDENSTKVPGKWQDSEVDDDYASERAHGAVRAVPIFTNEAGTSWSAFDYDEVRGRVVLASSFGRVVVLEL